MNFKFLLTRKSLDIFFRGVFSFCINVLPLTTDSPRGDSGQSVCICILLFYEHNSEERGRNKTKERVTVNNIYRKLIFLFLLFFFCFFINWWKSHFHVTCYIHWFAVFLLKIVTTSPYCQVIYNIWQGRPGRFISSFDFILSVGPRFLFCFSLFREFNAHTYKEMYVYKNANETIKMPAHTKTDVVPGKQTNPLFIESFVRFSLFDYTHTHTERGGEMCGNEQTLTVFIYTHSVYMTISILWKKKSISWAPVWPFCPWLSHISSVEIGKKKNQQKLWLIVTQGPHTAHRHKTTTSRCVEGGPCPPAVPGTIIFLNK